MAGPVRTGPAHDPSTPVRLRDFADSGAGDRSPNPGAVAPNGVPLTPHGPKLARALAFRSAVAGPTPPGIRTEDPVALAPACEALRLTTIPSDAPRTQALPRAPSEDATNQA